MQLIVSHHFYFVFSTTFLLRRFKIVTFTGFLYWNYKNLKYTALPVVTPTIKLYNKYTFAFQIPTLTQEGEPRNVNPPLHNRQIYFTVFSTLGHSMEGFPSHYALLSKSLSSAICILSLHSCLSVYFFVGVQYRGFSTIKFFDYFICKPYHLTYKCFPLFSWFNLHIL